MLLKSIEYTNFRPFKGTQRIDFTRPNDKSNENTFIILGDNTHGKSTIILSFIWCFYGKSKFNREKEILNREVEDSLRNGERDKAEVKVIFEDEGIEYTVRRYQYFRKTVNGLVAEPNTMVMSYVDNKDGQSKFCGKLTSEYEKAIRAILPEELSSFFFFEGEKDNNITKKDLGTAVKNLLGLEAMAKMKEHLHGTTSAITSTSVKGYFASQQSKKTTKIKVKNRGS